MRGKRNGLFLLVAALSALAVCSLQTGCVPPQAAAAVSGPGGMVDRVTERAVDYAKTKYADPIGQDIAGVLAKHFGGNATAAEIDSRLSEAQQRDAAAIAKESTPDRAAGGEHPLDVLLVRVCTLNERGEKIKCSAVQRVRREEWPAFWRSNQGDWKYPNGSPLKKFETQAVEPFAGEPPGGKAADGPQLPIVILPTSAVVRTPAAATAVESPPPLWKPTAAACDCNCACPGCTCSPRAASSPAPVYFTPARRGVRGGVCRSCS